MPLSIMPWVFRPKGRGENKEEKGEEKPSGQVPLNAEIPVLLPSVPQLNPCNGFNDFDIGRIVGKL